MIRARAMVTAPVLLMAMACGSSSSGSGGGYGSFGPPGSGACVSQAPTAFSNAVCACRDMVGAGTLTTHASASGGASVGVNGRAALGAGSNIEGGYTVYDGLQVGGLLSVRDDMLSTQSVDGAGVLTVGKDLSVGGPMLFAGALSVDGTLRLAQPSTTILPVHVGQMGPYVAPKSPPCACESSSLLPVAQAVTAAATHNDNAAHGLSTHGASLLGAGTLALVTGSYYFSDVTRIGLGKIGVQGAVALYLDGASVDIGVGRFVLAPGASLDLYVSGLLATAGAVTLGDSMRPEAFRLFVGGAGSMVASAGAQAWNGLIYAPEADVQLSGVTEVHGSIFAKTVAWTGVLDVTYAGGASPGGACPSPLPVH